jgi:hypothetical protein
VPSFQVKVSGRNILVTYDPESPREYTCFPSGYLSESDKVIIEDKISDHIEASKNG